MFDMYCILNCPVCGTLQIANHPIRKRACTVCSRSFHVKPDNIIAVFNDLRSARDNLYLIQGSKTSKIGKGPVKDNNGIKPHTPEGIRIKILSNLGKGKLAEDELIKILVGEGIEKGSIQREIENLRVKGYVFTPREGYLQKV